ncbi:Photosystem I reaction center subunit III [Phormidium sp. FACHB-1136]|jgi:photosystem I subunit 3|uniref:Photosystem I reaction center subunit III n=1 Tax=Phormidium sp. FACHB-1136 TaxID=2692848 RepID=UPI0016865B21|nr:Photosystem I reaction center subunit III [Phormidium sp. FACHB-1136]MBD2426471.1 Photosystem I reaction center subunit III [Phormidium sp. FACHB-1136]
MRRFFAVALVICLWFGIAAPASASIAGDNVSGLTPCGQNPAFLKRAATATSDKDKARFDLYGHSTLLCGDDGLPHLVVDGDLAHAGEFLIPSLLFLYIAGWIGWVGRAYLIAVRGEKNPEEKEIIIDVPLAIKCSLTGFAWPLAAFKDIVSGEMFASEDEITVSPR